MTALRNAPEKVSENRGHLQWNACLSFTLLPTFKNVLVPDCGSFDLTILLPTWRPIINPNPNPNPCLCVSPSPVCSDKCKHGTCNMQGQCCHDQCLGGCSEPGNASSCVSCRNLQHGSSCVEKCPPGYYVYKGWRCVSFSFCQVGGHSEARGWLVSGALIGTHQGCSANTNQEYALICIAYYLYKWYMLYIFHSAFLHPVMPHLDC